MEERFLEFMAHYWDKKSPLLLALSGGPDSLTLYTLLVEHKIPFGVAHVNHQWREESQQEAATLRGLCQANSIPYHEKVLSPPSPKAAISASKILL
jgi:tRNA(Ile)-lysidine synthase